MKYISLTIRLWWCGVNAEFWHVNIELDPSVVDPLGGNKIGERIRWWRWEESPLAGDKWPNEGLKVPVENKNEIRKTN